MEITAYSVLMDFCIMSGFLFIAQILRSKLKFLQNFYIPASLIAGFMGLFCGSQFLNILPFSSVAGSYAYLLVCVLFSGIFLGKTEKESLKEMAGKVGNTFLLNMSSEIVCFGAALFFGGIFMTILFPDVFVELSLLLPAGFMGGHGYAAAIGGTLNTMLGREDAVIIGQTFATLGLLTGLFGRIFAINYATRKKATRLISDVGSLPVACRTGFVPEEERKSMGAETVHPMSIDPLAWHVALILLCTGVGYAFYNWYKGYLPNIEVPMMCITMIMGVILQKLLNATNHGHYVDKHVVDRIGSGVTDYLVAFGIATIQVSVVMEFLFPILLMCVIGIGWPFIFVFFVGRRGFKNFWFERSIFVFGYITGVVAIGVTLLRIVDPEMKSGTLDDFGTAYTLQSVIELFLVSLLPVFAVNYGCIPVGGAVMAVGVGMILFNRFTYGSFKMPMDQL